MCELMNDKHKGHKNAKWADIATEKLQQLMQKKVS